MRSKRLLGQIFFTFAAVGALLFAWSATDHAGANPNAEKVVDAAGNLKIPSDYRSAYQYLGSWAVAAEKEGSKQMHTVYVSPEAVAAYRKDGEFPDGAVLIKEVFQTKTGQMTTGLVSHADALQGWFMMVKDSKNSDPESKLWGDGWTWLWFDASNPNKTTSTDYKKDCQACHVPAKATDRVYVDGYPLLKN